MLKLEGGSPPHPRNAPARALGFLRPWAFGLVSAAWLFSFGWVRWKNRAMIVELCRHFGYHYDTREPSELPSALLENVARSGGPLDIRELAAVEGNVSERELVAICRVVRSAEPRAVFEIGTFDGRTTLNLAANSPPDARIFTLDLPRAAIASMEGELHAHEVRYADKGESGGRYSSTDFANRIQQLYGDSASFDFSPYYGAVDLVFVDGSHTYDYVVNDSLHAIEMLRGGRGTILWHDYGRWDGVTRALNQLRVLDRRFSGTRTIAGTTLAILQA